MEICDIARKTGEKNQSDWIESYVICNRADMLFRCIGPITIASSYFGRHVCRKSSAARCSPTDPMINGSNPPSAKILL